LADKNRPTEEQTTAKAYCSNKAGTQWYKCTTKCRMLRQRS